MAGDMTLRDVSLAAAGGVTKKAQMALHALLRAPSVRRLLFSSTTVQLGDSFHGGISTPGGTGRAGTKQRRSTRTGHKATGRSCYTFQSGGG